MLADQRGHIARHTAPLAAAVEPPVGSADVPAVGIATPTPLAPPLGTIVEPPTPAVEITALRPAAPLSAQPGAPGKHVLPL
jgi:hypothetical protein